MALGPVGSPPVFLKRGEGRSTGDPIRSGNLIFILVEFTVENIRRVARSGQVTRNSESTGSPANLLRSSG